VLQILFEVSNNEAEHEVLLHGLCLAVYLGIKRLLVFGDSFLVIQKVIKELDINKETMDAYMADIRKLEDKFLGIEIHHVDHDENVGADVLSKLGSTRAYVPPGVFVQELHHPSVKLQNHPTTNMEASATVWEVLMIEDDCRTPFIDFIKEFKLPPCIKSKGIEAARIKRQSKGFVLVSDNLYKCSAFGILMRCVTLEEGKYIVREIHEGVCGNHAASRTLVGKAYRSGFF
jgi:ribonuclease HI